MIRLDTEDPIALCLGQFDGDHEMLAGLFDGDQLTEQVEEQYETLTVIAEVVLVPNIAFVTEPLQGHDLGAWLVAETIHRMLPTGIVLMWPYPVLSSGPDPDANPAQIAALDSAISRLFDHFQSCGLTPVESAAVGAGNVDRLRGASCGTVATRCGPEHHGVALTRSAPGRLPTTGTGRVKGSEQNSARHI